MMRRKAAQICNVVGNAGLELEVRDMLKVRMRATLLFLEAAIFTIAVPGTVTVWIPSLILQKTNRHLALSLQAAHVIALIPLALGMAIYLRCLWDFATSGRGIPAPLDHPKRLVVIGLYRYVRNPMYLGVLLVLLGEVVFFQSLALLGYAAVWLLIVHLNVIVYEEPNLRRKFATSYERYSVSVRRWIPGKKYKDELYS
jgi:protein-S-isoprenylcysteine O-methyltransferase Ste14